MTPTASSESARRRMVAQARTDTSPELALRRELHRQGLRYRLHRRPVVQLRRTADIVFGPSRVAVEVRGCFWHGCPEHGTSPKANSAWWRDKLARNKRRDTETEQLWGEAGWEVVVVWEHEDPAVAAQRVVQAVSRRRAKRTGVGFPPYPDGG